MGQRTIFTAAVVDTTGTPRSYAWSIGSRIVGSGSTLNYAFAHIGLQTIALKVIDSSGNVAVARLLVTVVAPKLPVHFTYGFAAYARFTVFTSLTATKVPRGANIKVSCKGSGCPFASRTVKAPASRLVCKDGHKHCKRRPAPALTTINLEPLVANRHLAVNTVLTLAATKPNTAGVLATFTIRSNVGPRVSAIKCLAPGSTKPGKGC